VTREPAGYGSPGAFRRALTDRLRTITASSRWPLPHLQRQFAYDRLLERLYTVDDGWILKGAAALLARDLGTRATIDVDVYRARVREVAEADLREAAGRDIGDWFRFEIAAGHPVGDGAALASEAERRDVMLPTRFDVPDRTLWEPGYTAEAARSLLPVGRTLAEALAIVRACLDALLARTAAGTWDPNTGRWRF
jgi:hypothetical protein